MRIFVVFHSKTGNTYRLALAVAEGVTATGGEAVLRKVPDAAPPEVIERNDRRRQTYTQLQDVPDVQVKELPQADGLVFGSPVHFGNMAAELKQVFDRMGGLWVKRALVGKPAALFCTNETLHCGKEAALLSMILPVLAHGMILVGVPASVEDLDRYGSYYGAVATNEPEEGNLAVARCLGRRITEVARRLANFRE